MEGEDTNEIRRLTEALTQVSHKMAASVYGKNSGSQDPRHGYADENNWQNTASGSDDDVVDADYQEVA
jgi:molecular chaperone DnaK